jgi:hypothetical protein
VLPAVPRSAPALARLTAVVLLALGLVLAVPGTASAHTELRSSDPADGGTVTTPLPAVTLTFSARVLGGEVTVTGPDGTPVGTGEVVHDGAVLTAPVTLTAAGRHTVTWSAVAADGHVLDGAFAFEHAPAALPTTGAPSPGTPATAAPTTVQPPDGDPGGPASPTADPTASSATAERSATADPTASSAGTDPASSSGDDGTPGWVLPTTGAAALAALLGGGLVARRRRR